MKLDDKDKRLDCTCEGCNGTFGPGCMVASDHASYHKCGNNKRFLNRVFWGVKFEQDDTK